MPRLRNSAEEEKKKEFQATIKKYFVLRDTNATHSAKVIDISPSEFYKKLKDFNLFRVGELIHLYEYLRVPPEERINLEKNFVATSQQR